MEISLVVMMLWCAVLLWCSLNETERHLQFVFTVMCFSGGVLFFGWYDFANEFFSFRFWRFKWHKHNEHLRILSCLVIFLTVVYGARVLGTRIDKSRKK